MAKSFEQFKRHLWLTLKETHKLAVAKVSNERYIPTHPNALPCTLTAQFLEELPNLVNNKPYNRLVVGTNTLESCYAKHWANSGKIKVFVHGKAFTLPINDVVSDYYYVELPRCTVKAVRRDFITGILGHTEEGNKIELISGNITSEFWEKMYAYESLSEELQQKLPSFIREHQESQKVYKASVAYLLAQTKLIPLVNWDKYGFFDAYFISELLSRELSDRKHFAEDELIIPTSHGRIHKQFYYMRDLLRFPTKLVSKLIIHPEFHIDLAERTVNIKEATRIDQYSAVIQAERIIHSVNKKRVTYD